MPWRERLLLRSLAFGPHEFRHALESILPRLFVGSNPKGYLVCCAGPFFVYLDDGKGEFNSPNTNCIYGDFTVTGNSPNSL